MDIKNEVLYRVYFLLFGIVVPAALVLVYRTVDLAILNGDKWREAGKENYLDYRTVEADRGNIFAGDGNLLATSIPYFNIRFDPLAADDEAFEENLDTLAHCLAYYVLEDVTVGGAREYLLELREGTDRYVLLKKQVSYAEKKFIESFPLFRLGRNGGGFIAVKRSERKRPFGILAQRTVGYVREGAKPVGLEGYYDEVLGGQPGQQLMVCVDRRKDLWMPVDDLSAIEPQSGNDIVTTLDLDIQDIAERALNRAVNAHDAEWGTAIVLEVETGAVRAVANLGRTDQGWWETYNFAVGTASEPGSTFKAASVLALLEDGYLTLDDSIRIYNGKAEFYEETMEDASPYSYRLDTISLREAFEISSNVGIAKTIERFYGEKNDRNDDEGAARFVRRLKQFNLHQPIGIEIEGEANPYIKEAYSEADYWSGTTLPWMSIGYELELTPLQLLTFYNAVANDGKMMKPYLVSEIQRMGKTEEQFYPTVINRRIASKKAISQLQELLRAVVEHEQGTAHDLYTTDYAFAGKTGTAQVNYKKGPRGNSIGGHQASFVGYFPAEAPQYSCIVVINKPRRGGFYGGDVAGPVFREIADNIYRVKPALHPVMNAEAPPVAVENTLPGLSIGAQEDFRSLLAYLDMNVYGEPTTQMAVLRPYSDSLKMENRTMAEETVPNVVGLGLRDALHVLENRGLKVSVEGVGKVARQSIIPGTRIRGQKIKLYLR
ncbi:MAG: penicillin-binding protein [Phaeodactylibacter sp.]|uniref:penicillin-binding protein n=1 Tax=Phaeodactylibacter sp. TaxID=1940289 RepID=UPI0032EAC18A